MAKYVGVQIPIYNGSTATGAVLVSYTNSGTTTAATTGKLTDTGGVANFTTNVVVGDYVFAPDRTFSKVTAVDSDSVLSISGQANATLETTPVDYKIVAAANVYSGALTGAEFLTDVRGGDMIVNTTTNQFFKIKDVVNDTTLTIEKAGGLIVGDDFFILSDREDGPNRKVRVDNATLIRGNATNGQVTVHYKRGATNQKLTFNLGDTPAAAFDVFSTQFKKTAELVLESEWTNVSMTMPYVQSDGTVGIQWATSFTFA
tara:strand:+ start:17258 stop:18034 length:777 start_codon:yes stop_codon:yes gene_type:complete